MLKVKEGPTTYEVTGEPRDQREWELIRDLMPDTIEFDVKVGDASYIWFPDENTHVSSAPMMRVPFDTKAHFDIIVRK